MKKAVRRGLFWLLLVLYSAATVLWVLHVPHNPANLLKAVPGSATVITMHDKLADRWTDIVQHPVAVMLSSSLGADSEEWAEMPSDPGIQNLMDLIGRRELVTAYVPYAGSDYQPAWVIASWIGGRSHRLRWSVPFFKLRGLERVGEIGNWPVWVYRWEDEGQTGEITLVLVEGMLLGCISSDPTAIETVIESYNGIFPSVWSRDDLNQWKERLLQSSRDDRIWYKNELERSTSAFSGPLLLDFELGQTNSLRGRAVLPAPEVIARQDESVELSSLSSLWKGHPISVAVADGAALYQIAVTPNVPYIEPVMEMLQDTDGSALALGLFGEKYSGRFKGIKIPTIMAAVQIPETNELRTVVQKLADQWNARYQWGVVPVLYLADTSVVYRLEGIADNFYSSMNASEQVAFTRVGNWLVASSNLKALERMLKKSGEREENAFGEWVEKATATFASDQRFFMGTDLERANATLRLVISAYSLKLLFEDPQKTKEQRQTLNDAKAWLENLAQLGQLYIYGDADSEETGVSFEAGP